MAHLSPFTFPPSRRNYSVYVCDNLPDDHPLKYMRASTVRDHAGCLPEPDRRRKFGGYDTQGLKITVTNPAGNHPTWYAPVQNNSMWKEGNRPGPARVVWNNTNKHDPYLLYHDSTKPNDPGHKHSPFSKATYYPSGAAALALQGAKQLPEPRRSARVQELQLEQQQKRQRQQEEHQRKQVQRQQHGLPWLTQQQQQALECGNRRW